MPFNRSIHAERDAALLTHVSDWADGFWITVRCPGRTCPVHHLPVARFVRDHGGTLLPAFCKRLRCEGCRRRPSAITLRRTLGGKVEPGDLTLPLFGGGWPGV